MIPKFRVWDKANKEMLKVDALDFFLEEIRIINDDGSAFSMKFKDVILMQSTGLKDKNGVEVFEGDIVMVSEDFLNIIDYRVDDGCWRLRPIDKKWACSYFSNYYDKSGWEILGNIYEDKELLK